MPKIESVRPGEAFASTLAEHPLPELLMGILRGNLTGALELDLGPGANTVHFRDGVPVSVRLPALGVSLAGVLAERGELAAAVAPDVTARARSSGTSESRIIEVERIVAEGALREGVRARARLELERLFDLGPHGFVFREGMAVPPDADLAVLQPLPIMFAGLARRASAALVGRFIARYGEHRFRLADTYPRDVDPFEWGEDVERAMRVLEAPEPRGALEGAGLDPNTAAVVLATLHTADMLEVHEPGPRRARDGGSSWDPAHAAESASFHHDQIRAAIAARLDALADASLLEVLRVGAGASHAELERAHAQLVRRMEARGDDPVARASIALYDDALRTLRDPVWGPAYRAALQGSGPDPVGTRRRVETEPKIMRAIEAAASGRAGEASYWVDWAARLEPGRVELKLYRELLMVVGAPAERRAEIAALVAPTLRATAAGLPAHDRAWGAVACVEWSLGDHAAAERRLAAMGPAGAPWRAWLAPGGRR